MKINLKNLFKNLAILLPLVILSALFLSKCYLSMTHTLENNQQWKSSKIDLQKGVIGATAYWITPISLVNNQLNLDAWLGYQEVLYKDKIDLQQIEFDLNLQKDSYFSFIYNKTEEHFSGVRLSRTPFYKSIDFVAENEGKFIKKESLVIKELKENNQIKILFEKDHLLFYLNGSLIKTIEEKFASSFYIGFRGGPFPSSVDNIQIKLRNSNQIIWEDFKNKKTIFPSFFVLIGLILLTDGLIYFKKKKNSSENSKEKPIYFVFTFNFVVFIIGLSLYLIQLSPILKNYYFEKYYFKTVAFLRNYKTTIETKKEAIDRLRKTYSSKNPLTQRILFIGTSQTWGAGAKTEEEIFVKQLEKKLNKENSGKIHYELINTGISGERAARLWEPYEKEWIQLNPEIVLINLSNNDTNSIKFSEYLQKYIELNQSKGIQTILILEANAIDQVRSHLAENHQTMREIAKKYNLTLIDLHHCLLEKYDSGFLWWDFVHPTSYGHQLAAECIYPTLANVIQQTKQVESKR